MGLIKGSGKRRLHDVTSDTAGSGLSQDLLKADCDMHKHATPLPSLSLCISDGQLLEAIAACGSISAAGRVIGMSYKRAKNLVDEINHICDRKAVDQQIDGSKGGGSTLTPFVGSLVARCRKV